MQKITNSTYREHILSRVWTPIMNRGMQHTGTDTDMRELAHELHRLTGKSVHVTRSLFNTSSSTQAITATYGVSGATLS
jgi:hypothetical protein